MSNKSLLFSLSAMVAVLSLPTAAFAGGGIDIDDFSVAADMRLVGDAEVVGSVLRVTPSVPGGCSGDLACAGAAWNKKAQDVENGFTTTFEFSINDWTWTKADGMAFVIQGAKPPEGAHGPTSALGSAGGNIGYGWSYQPWLGGDYIAGIANSLAVEIDTYSEPLPCAEPAGNPTSPSTRSAGSRTWRRTPTTACGAGRTRRSTWRTGPFTR